MFFNNTTTSADLPHPKISESVYRIVEEALIVAWSLLKSNPRQGFDLQNATEDVVTQELYEQLYDEVFKKEIVSGFNSQLFADITREPKGRSFDYTHLDKMPDMRIKLLNRSAYKPSQDGIFIECKPVDSDHSIGVHYCDKGIIRFISGDYAWAMVDALMVGYARPGYSIPGKLTATLSTPSNQWSTIVLPYPVSNTHVTNNNEIVYATQHNRTFNYIETGELAPPIAIRHLWLRRD
jgi:hypothetical protein